MRRQNLKPSRQPSRPKASDDTSLIEQAADSIDSMEEAIAIDDEVKQISRKSRKPHMKPLELALEVSKKAQASADKAQKAIEATFQATERAFEAAKNAGYEIELSELSAPVSNDELLAQLAEIRSKNTELRQTNESLKSRIDALGKNKGNPL